MMDLVDLGEALGTETRTLCRPKHRHEHHEAHWIMYPLCSVSLAPPLSRSQPFDEAREFGSPERARRALAYAHAYAHSGKVAHSAHSWKCLHTSDLVLQL